MNHHYDISMLPSQPNIILLRILLDLESGATIYVCDFE